jgi:predicted permease
MNWKHRIQSSLPNQVDDDVLEELAQHAAAIYASARAEGLDAADADLRIADQIQAWSANPTLLRHRPKREPVVEPPSHARPGLGSVLQDTRYAWRLIRRQPAYAALLVATMALGIAATTVLGSVTYGVLMKPLPWANAPRLVKLFEARQGSTRRMPPLMSNATFVEWAREPSQTLDALGAWSTSQMTISGGGRPERIRVAQVTPSLLTMLEAVPVAGRIFAPGDEEPARSQIVLLSHGFWQQRFGGKPDVIGTTVRLNSTSYTIVGVMPADFAFPDRSTRMWAPLFVPPVVVKGREGMSISVFQALGRLRPGATVAQVAAEGTARGRNAPSHAPVAMAMFGSTGPIEDTPKPLLEAITGDVKPAILILLVAVALLLVTATANAASLQLARATGRRRELAIRAALGAGRARLVRQTLVENLLLGLLGGAAGLLLAAVMHRALPAVLPSDFPRVSDLAFDIRIQAFAVVIAIAAGLGCGILPAWHVARADVVPALVEDSLAPVGGGLRSRTARVRAAIMAGQVAIASVLLVGSLLLCRSFYGLLNADIGYDASSVLTATLIMPDGEFTPERRFQTVEEVAGRLRAIPGVTRVGYTTSTPFSNVITLSSFPLRKPDGSTSMVQSGLRLVSAGYFAALGQRVIEGREYADGDATEARTLIIVNR